MIKKTTLKLNQIADSNINLIGISSSLKDYRFVWLLNNALSLNFKRIDDFNFYTQSFKDNQDLFPLFYFLDEENFLEYFLWDNKINQNVSIHEFSQIDFFILIKGVLNETQKKQFIKNLKINKNISVFDIDYRKKIKDFVYLLQDLEIYIIEINKKEKNETYGNFKKKPNRFVDN